MKRGEIISCTAAQSMTIFGGEAEGCLIYDFIKHQLSVEVKICGGLILAVSTPKVMLFGLEVSHKKLGCIYLVDEVLNNANDAKEAAEILTKEISEGNAIKKIMLKELKKALEEEGKLTPNEIKKIDEIKFGPFIDATDRGPKIHETLDQCRASSGTPIS